MWTLLFLSFFFRAVSVDIGNKNNSLSRLCVKMLLLCTGVWTTTLYVNVPFSVCQKVLQCLSHAPKFCSICLLWSLKTEKNGGKHKYTYKTLILQCLQPQCSNSESVCVCGWGCVCLWDQCQSWRCWMPACEPPERGPGAQQIGTQHFLVPPACLWAHVCLCGEQANICCCVWMCVFPRWRLLRFFGPLWLRVASAV